MSVQEDYLRGIADAIRAQDGTSAPIKATDFPRRIRAIVGNTDAFATTGGTYQQQRLLEIAEAIRAADDSSGEIQANTFAERIRAIPKKKDWVAQQVDKAMAMLEQMDMDVPTNTDEGQIKWISLLLGPLFFLAPGNNIGVFYELMPTQSGGNVDDFGNIYNYALASLTDILSEAEIDITLEDAQVVGNRRVNVTTTMYGSLYLWETGSGLSTMSDFYNILVVNLGKDTLEESIQVLTANAEELFYSGYTMCNEVYGYDEQ